MFLFSLFIIVHSVQQVQKIKIMDGFLFCVASMSELSKNTHINIMMCILD